MRILHYCSSFSFLSETFIYDYVTELERQGTDNYVVTHNRCNIADRPFEKVSVVNLPARWNVERLIRRVNTYIQDDSPKLSFWPIIRRRLKKTIEKINPNVIHAHFGPEGVKVAPIAKELNIPLVTTFYGYDISRLRKSDFWLAQYETLWENVSAITVLSEEMKESVIEIGALPHKVSIVHLSRDISGFDFVGTQTPITKFVSVGRLTYKKGHFKVIEAVKRIADSGWQIELEIIGDGELENEIEQYIKEIEGQNIVKLLGALPNPEVKQKLKEADAFILCSETAPDGDKEGTPTVLVEAQAIGLPCISTKHAGIPEMVPEENHFLLAQEGNTEDIYSKIRKLMECTDKELQRISKLGRQKIESDFNLSKEVGNLIELYKKSVA